MQCRGENRQNAARDSGTGGVKEVETIGWYPSCKCAGMQKLPKYPRAPSTKGLDEATKETRLVPWRAECARITAERRVLCQAVEKFTTKRAVVLDPFGGAGTTALVADRLQRDSLIIELNADYAEMARRRITGDSPLFAIAAE